MPQLLFRPARSVSTALHEQFAQLSGDRNPMHMDPVAARRTQAGIPVVHGVHTLLWALEELADTLAAPPDSPVAQLKAKFLKWVYLDDLAELSSPSRSDDGRLTLQVEVAGLPVLTAELSFGPPAPPPSAQSFPPSPDKPAVARDRTFADLEELAGDVYTPPPAEVVALFPRLCRLLGPTAVAEIVACSCVVGMEAPGLHSMFSKLDLHFNAVPPQPAAARTGLHYAVSSHDPRFRKVRIAVEGQALTGALEAFLRVPPVQQASMGLIAQHVSAGEFRGVRALVIGGSRGLGELTARLIAGGEGDVTLTYALGQAEAEAVVDSIQSWGGRAQAIPYDVRIPPAPQLLRFDRPPTHLFYFATSTIFKPKLGIFSAATLQSFTQFYLQGFYDLCVALTNPPPPEPLQVFYPSTTFLVERPAGMAEYAMIKAAGEQLCADMNLYMAGLEILVARLPRLPTDQTAGILPERETDALEALLPLIRQMKMPEPGPLASATTPNTAR